MLLRERFRRIFQVFAGCATERRWALLSLLLLASGAAVRLHEFCGDRSMWIDECFLALNIRSHDYRGLTGSLDLNQAAPLLFLFAQKARWQLGGANEFTQRVVPLIAGILALLLYFRVAWRLLPPASCCVAVALFAFSDKLSYYSAEAKQYGVDVAVAVVLLWLGVSYLDVRWTALRAAWSAMVGLLAIGLSFVAPFVLFGVGLSWWWQIRCRFVSWVSAAVAVWAAGFGCYWYFVIRQVGNHEFLHEYWSFAFAPFPPDSFGDLHWYRAAFNDVLSLYDHGSLWWAYFLLVPLGSLQFLRKCPAVAMLLWLPAIGALAASAIRQYPFHGRLLLFLSPFIPLLLCSGLAQLQAHLSRLQWTLAAVILLTPTVWTSSQFWQTPRMRSDVRRQIAYVQENCYAEDVVFLSWHSSILYEYYRSQLGDIGVEVYYGGNEKSTERDFLNFVEQRSPRRVWLVHSVVVDWKAPDPALAEIRNEQLSCSLNRLGHYLGIGRQRGATVELYRLQEFN